MYGPQDSDHPSAAATAGIIVPLIVDLIRPATVLDVGCGSGGWVSAFLGRGVDATGVDAAHLPLDTLKFDRSRFIVHDLRRPLDLGRHFDLVLCLEVAEHLPPHVADTLIATLVRHAPVVLFSAAIPGQGGLEHVNERWQSYWAATFRSHGYEPIDCVRPRVWEHSEVACWYAQNMLLYADGEHAHDLRQHAVEFPLDVVHPGVWEVIQDDLGSAREALSRLA